MRLFIAVNFNEDIKNILINTIDNLKHYASQGNFTRQANLHLTLVFLGEIAPVRISRIKEAMEKITVEKFEFSLGGLGSFKRNGGDLYWLGVNRNNLLSALHSQLCRELREAGFTIEQRDFRPHLTLGRGVRLAADFNKEAFGKTIPSLQLEAAKISLMKSERINGKLTYTEIYAKYLTEEENTL